MKIKSFKDWMLKRFDRRQMHDIANNGANCGFAGLVYYYETTKLYQRYHQSICTPQQKKHKKYFSGYNLSR